ncbi:riboflavin synthase [Candidatus Micrarchaeota archaeon]|nr:riboflavin synthase [Candidatus Micrarchaeota archaeon]
MRLGIVDTMFARVDMGSMAMEEVRSHYPEVEIVRRTVPGVKDLPVECKKLLDGGCDSCIALGMVGGAPVDAVCAHEASLGIQQAKLLTGKHIIEVFVHENEAWSEKEFYEICGNRTRKHAHNAVLLVTDPEKLVESAGKGVRQGKGDEGPVSLEERKAHIAFVVSEFNGEITDLMLDAAREAAGEQDAEIVSTLSVSGAFEIPLAAKKLLMDKNVDCIAVLGAVVKGETAHDEVIVKTVANRLSELSLEYRKPVGFGIIGHDADWDAAEERAGEYAERAVKAAMGLSRVLRND